MPNLIVFDLDGVLVDSKDLHYQALNLALMEKNPDWAIPYEEHVERYNGNPTKVKLGMLSKNHPEITDALKVEIEESKQRFTLMLMQNIGQDEELVDIFCNLIKNNYKIAVASNSIRSTVELILKKLGVDIYTDLVLSNEDVLRPKPSPEIYIKAMDYFDASPEETIIFEDSEIGKRAAKDSGANLVEVKGRSDIDQKLVSWVTV
jgi:beta-phosphoglucomutase-like phosphatase (HAD superfamily)